MAEDLILEDSFEVLKPLLNQTLRISQCKSSNKLVTFFSLPSTISNQKCHTLLKASANTIKQIEIPQKNGDMAEHIPEIQSRCMENDTCLAEDANASAGSLKTSPEVFSSAIEFYVWSDEGINLYVDLNCSPLDWTERLKNEVYICESIYTDKCLQKNLCWFKGRTEIANSFQWNNHADLIKGNYLQKETPSSSNLTINNCREIDQPDEADGSVIFSAMPHAIKTDASENRDEDQRIISSETDFDAQNQKFAGSEFCAAEDNCAMNLALDINDTLPKKENCEPISGGPSSLATLDHQNSMLESEICETSTLQNSCSMLNLSVESPGNSAAGSMDIQSSGIEQCPKDVSCSPCRALPKRGSKNVSDYSLPTFAEKSVRCFQFPESLEKPLPVSHILESDGAHKRKRKLIENETRCRYSEPDRRVLRSVTNKAKRVLPRRSGRLILKTVSS